MSCTDGSHKRFLPYMTTEEARAAADEGAVILLPLGTVESNGPHQLLGCDYLISEHLVEAVTQRGVGLRFPTLPLGISELHDTMPGTFGLSEALFKEMLRQIFLEIARNGFRHLVIFNCHRHNHQAIEILARDLRRQKKLNVAVIDPLEVARDLAADAFQDDHPNAIGHGGEPLASLMCHLHPSEMRMDRKMPGEMATFHGLEAISSTRFRFQGSRVGLFPLAREINSDGVWADLSNTNANRGKVAFERLCDFTEAFVREFARMSQVS